jgi:hypothetical protein
MPTWAIVLIAVGSALCGAVIVLWWLGRSLPSWEVEKAAMKKQLGDGGKELATVLTSSPGLRAKLFANPTKTVGKQLPARKNWDYGINAYLLFVRPWRFVAQRHLYRAALAKQTLEEIARRIDEERLTSAVNTDAVFEDFFGPIVRVSQRTFNGVFVLSVLAFVVACGLIGAGVYIAIYPPADGSSTVLGSVFGASGAVGALGSAYAMAIGGITAEARRNARLRLVLTGFATQLGQLRGYAEFEPGEGGHPRPLLQDIRDTNSAIYKAMDDALLLIPEELDSADADKEARRNAERRARGGV